MAIVALDLAMLADERKPDKVVVENDINLPSAIVMTLFAIGAQLPVMNVVGLMTRYAGGRDVGVRRPRRVTILARRSSMFSRKYEFGLARVIEGSGRPVVRGMALFA